MKAIKQVLLPIKPIARLLLPAGAEVLEIRDRHQVKVISMVVDTDAPTVTREFRLVPFDKIDAEQDDLDHVEQALAGTFVCSIMEYGWGVHQLIFDCGEVDAPGQEPKTEPYEPADKKSAGKPKAEEAAKPKSDKKPGAAWAKLSTEKPVVETAPQAEKPLIAKIYNLPDLDDTSIVRYYHHAESDSVGRIEIGEPWPTTGEPIEPINEKEYFRLSAELGDL